MGGKPEEKPLMESVMENARGFALFLYNKEEGTVLGRTGRGWARISVFYLFYYLFLAGLFALSINLCLSCLDEETPYFQTRLQTPGVTLQPKLPSKVALSTDIQYTVGAPSQDKLVNHLNTFMANYTDQDFGPCSAAGYGYEEGEPCIFVKVNKIIGWQPYSFGSLQEEAERETNRKDNSKAPSLASTLNAPYNPNLMYIRCYGLKADDQDNLGVVSYYPEHGGIDFSNFPYEGKVKQPKYIPPIVAVKLSNAKKGVEISVGCKAYALNILDDIRTNSGFMHFKVEITEE